MTNNINEIETKLRVLMNEFLPPLRAYKEIKSESFEKFYFELENLIILLEGEEVVKRTLAGLMIFIYHSIRHQAEYTQDPEPILKEAFRVKNYMRKLFLTDFI